MPLTWTDEALTIEHTSGTVLIIRCHEDPLQIPGDVRWTCIIEIDDAGHYEPKILSGRRGPTLDEIKRLSKYLASKGYTGSWRRYKNDKKPKTVHVHRRKDD